MLHVRDCLDAIWSEVQSDNKMFLPSEYQTSRILVLYIIQCKIELYAFILCKYGQKFPIITQNWVKLILADFGRKFSVDEQNLLNPIIKNLF